MTSSAEKLERLRKSMEEKDASAGGERTVYQHWKMKEGQDCTLRFLWDGDETNEFFWREKLVYRFQYPDPDAPGAAVTAVVPCRETWDGPKTCPVKPLVNNEFRRYHKESEQYKYVRKFWPKKEIFYQGFVRKSSFQEDAVPENPIRTFSFRKKVHDYIRNSILNRNEATRMTTFPVDPEEGRDIVISKIKPGEYVDYVTIWANNPTSLTDNDLAAIEQFGIPRLIDKIGQRPSKDALDVQVAMFKAAYNGDPWDKAWEEFYTPFRGLADADHGGDEDGDGGPPPPAKKNEGFKDKLARLQSASAGGPPTEAATTTNKLEEPPPADDAPPKVSSRQEMLDRIKRRTAAGTGN